MLCLQNIRTRRSIYILPLLVAVSNAMMKHQHFGLLRYSVNIWRLIDTVDQTQVMTTDSVITRSSPPSIKKISVCGDVADCLNDVPTDTFVT